MLTEIHQMLKARSNTNNAIVDTTDNQSTTHSVITNGSSSRTTTTTDSSTSRTKSSSIPDSYTITLESKRRVNFKVMMSSEGDPRPR